MKETQVVWNQTVPSSVPGITVGGTTNQQVKHEFGAKYTWTEVSPFADTVVLGKLLGLSGPQLPNS